MFDLRPFDFIAMCFLFFRAVRWSSDVHGSKTQRTTNTRKRVKAAKKCEHAKTMNMKKHVNRENRQYIAAECVSKKDIGGTQLCMTFFRKTRVTNKPRNSKSIQTQIRRSDPVVANPKVISNILELESRTALLINSTWSGSVDFTRHKSIHFNHVTKLGREPVTNHWISPRIPPHLSFLMRSGFTFPFACSFFCY